MPPGDLLAARVTPWRVADRDLDDARPLAHQLAEQLIVEFDAFRPDGPCGDHAPAEGFVATFVVREPLSVSQICDGGDKHVADVAGEIRRPTFAEDLRMI